MLHFKDKMHRIRFLASVRLSVRLCFRCSWTRKLTAAVTVVDLPIGSVTITTESSTNGATTPSRMKIYLDTLEM